MEVQKFSKIYVLIITFIQIKYKFFIRRVIMIKGWKCLRNNKYLAEWKKFQLKERIWNLSSYTFSILTWPIIIHTASDSATSSTEWRNLVNDDESPLPPSVSGIKIHKESWVPIEECQLPEYQNDTGDCFLLPPT